MSASLPSHLKHVSLFFERLPGIGQKTANRLAFYLLRLPEKDLKEIAANLADLKEKTKKCKICNNLTEEDMCDICADPRRNHNLITVVEDVIDLLSFEQGNIYQGVYYVLHGKIDPLNHIGPEDIYIDALLKRAKSEGNTLEEVILATNPDMEGEATAMFIRNKLNEITAQGDASFKVTRLGYGLPMGGNLEYADYMTLRKAIENRSEFKQ
jgi:recombination protein RecR